MRKKFFIQGYLPYSKKIVQHNINIMHRETFPFVRDMRDKREGFQR